MRLSLSLQDYLKEGLQWIPDGGSMCPVCYENDCLSEDLLWSIEHIVRCYYLLQFEILTEYQETPGREERDAALTLLDEELIDHDHMSLVSELILSLL